MEFLRELKQKITQLEESNEELKKQNETLLTKYVSSKIVSICISVAYFITILFIILEKKT